ncbi:membrane protein insertion efficiency factor YidD [Lichenicola cladoniae]|uniref:Putative membrane protein insertion efficiency factor n=1 Tax=Lichenicola cladoniae TaxID=1484109 RepID=A0A6M8HPR1_9PROT|nr:membrane protein insertion efficiency factor YidD [Lichenicola cladoniae]NPD66450.1 membrane protein insertion efficiency factor YidD [Acetobacteraceae bacterium]QKE90318.1 membrane protein insertion efficiency factor YidD [Lichenicola cladoniae]
MCLIRLYQVGLSPILGPNCRFMPTCSDYALQAITLHGPVRGSALAGRRMLRCHPWHAGGHDPVPTGCSCSGASRIAHPFIKRDRPAC